VMSEIKVFESSSDISRAIADDIVKLSIQAIKERGQFVIAFSGGSLPKTVCPGLLSKYKESKDQLEWSKWQVFFSDERCVAASSDDSTFKLLQTEWLNPLQSLMASSSSDETKSAATTTTTTTTTTGFPLSNVHAIDFNLISKPDEAAQAYEIQIRRVFGIDNNDTKQSVVLSPPSFDLILWGMGEDGHTCSLFPGHSLLGEQRRLVAPITDSPKPPPSRITLTLPVLNAARHVAFVATGAGKKDILKRVLEDANAPSSLPSAMIRPRTPVRWYLDRPAALNLTTHHPAHANL